MLAGHLALTIAALFTGAAIYINIAEQAARVQLDDRSVLAEWKLAYKRGYMMQASLAIMGGLFGLVAFLSSLDWRWLLAALIVRANWPCTIFVTMPTNRRLIDTLPEAATTEMCPASPVPGIGPGPRPPSKTSRRGVQWFRLWAADVSRRWKAPRRGDELKQSEVNFVFSSARLAPALRVLPERGVLSTFR
jgi:hypothetical protein